jgi:hypothetical protein
MEQKSIKTNGHDSLEDKSPTIVTLNDAYKDRYEEVLEQAVKFLDKLSSYVRMAEYEISRAINGKNVVVRAVGVRDTEKYLQKLVKETDDWHAVIETMKQGKDVHREENCKGNKLEIVAGSEYEFGQYIIDQSSPKWCEENTEGKDYIERVTHDSN